MILKAKVYVKNPSDAPEKVKLQRGKRGGQYYLSDDIETYKPKEFKIKTIQRDSKEYKNVMDNMEDDEFYPHSITQTDIDELSNVIKSHNIDLSNVSINLLPFSMPSAFAFVIPDDPANIYIPHTNKQEYDNWMNDYRSILAAEKYSDDELDFNLKDRIAATIVHEVGHTKVHKFINLASMKTDDEFRDKEYSIFAEYVEYLHVHYGIGYEIIKTKLDEMLAEDYRLFVGGRQIKITNRYLYPTETRNSSAYKYQQGRLDILKKMGVF